MLDFVTDLSACLVIIYFFSAAFLVLYSMSKKTLIDSDIATSPNTIKTPMTNTPMAINNPLLPACERTKIITPKVITPTNTATIM